MITLEEIPSAVESLHETFRTEKTTSESWRRGQLNALLTLLDEGRQELCEAMKKDVNRSIFEGYMTEINMVANEATNALHNLSSWMKPERKTTNLFNVPSNASYVYNDPMGVVLIMGAWNYNVVLTLEPLVGAIAGGNCVLLKPGAYASHSSEVMSRLVTKYLDNDCIKIVCGNRVVNGACLKQKFDMIFFTGSPSVGKLVAHAAADNLTPIVLELGGKSPCIVDKTCSLELSVRRLVHGALLNAGQTCVRPDYFLVHEDIGNEFIHVLKSCIKDFYGENPEQSEYFGRIINENSVKRITKLIEDSRDRIVLGGQVNLSERYIAPTILDFGSDFQAFANSSVMGEEVFGPVFPVVRYRNIEDAIRYIRSGEKPLALYCFTSDSSIREAVLNRTYSGGAVINDVCVHLSNANIPFGGVGNSGMGNYHGKYSFDAFTHQKGVMQRSFLLSQMEDALRYPPYGPWNQTILGLLQMPLFSVIWDKVMHEATTKNAFIVALLAYILKLKLRNRL